MRLYSMVKVRHTFFLVKEILRLLVYVKITMEHEKQMTRLLRR